MATTTNGFPSNSLLVDGQGGVTVIPAIAELTRLNYFDGRFLRADDLQTEQDYLRTLVRLSNRAGGAGVVDGFDAKLSADQSAIVIAPGLALDGDGRTLLLPVPHTLDAGKLIEAAERAASSAPLAPPAAAAMMMSPGKLDLYLLTVGFAESACGQESVYGNLCADPCSGATNARYLVEGVMFRVAPITLDLSAYAANKAVLLEAKHLRSRVASAYFAREATGVQSLISSDGLRAETWCLGAAAAAGGPGVPLAVFQRSGGSIQFLDAWTARRERMETPPRRYWAQRMAMRPWDAYLAQILQFQCQLHELLGGGGATKGLNGWAAERLVIADAAALLATITEAWRGFTEDAKRAGLDLDLLKDAKAKLDAAAASKPTSTTGQLVEGGIIELPPAGYLPVDSASGEPVEPQVRRMLGRGLDLRFCVVRPDYVPHALEERQHMERISLLDGITDPTHLPEVDVLVPSGRIERTEPPPAEEEFVVQITTNPLAHLKYALKTLQTLDTSGGDVDKLLRSSWSFDGAGRRRPGGEVVLAAGIPLGAGSDDPHADPRQRGLFALMKMDGDPFSAPALGEVGIQAEIVFAVDDPTRGAAPFRVDVRGTLSAIKSNGSVVLAELILELTGSSGEVKLECGIKLARQASGTVVTVSLPTDEVLTLTWMHKGAGTELTAKVGDTQLLLADLAPRTGILEQTPPPPPVTQALDLIQSERPADGEAWRAHADAQLFPPRATAAATVQLYPTLDWVLFCRRRDCLCGISTAPVPVRRFQVWSINVSDLLPWNDEKKAQMLKYPTRYRATKVDVIEFPATTAALDKASDAPARWKSVLLGATMRIVWSGIAMNAPADGLFLEVSRLAAYEGAIAATLPPMMGGAQREVLAAAPPTLAVPDTDGVIVVAVVNMVLYQLLLDHATPEDPEK
jgi:hypothetical protein